MKMAAQNISLQDTMNHMARRMDRLLDDHDRSQPSETATQELRFWINVDPVLADLHKLLVDAKAYRAQIAARHGAKDPLTDVAADMEDSAESAVQTRLIELRGNQETRAAVAAMMRKAHEDDVIEEIEAEKAQSARFWRDFSAPRERVVKTEAEDSFWLVLVSMLALRQSLSQAHKTLSIAATFGQATANDRNGFRQARRGTA